MDTIPFTTPFFLYEAVVSLYPSDSTGQALTGAALWIGAVAKNLRASMALEGPLVGGSGDLYKTRIHTDELHEINAEKLWVVPTVSPSAFKPGRNQLYVLDIIWTDRKAGAWYRRTYYKVSGMLAELASRGVLEFDERHKFEARYYTDQGGSLAGGPPIYTPTVPVNAPQPVGFFKENELQVGSYLLGQYRWQTGMNVLSAKAIGLASQGEPTVLTLEVNGVLTSHTVTLPIGTVNQEVEAESDFTGVSLSPGDEVRWKITGGPSDGVEAAWQVALIMMAQQA